VYLLPTIRKHGLHQANCFTIKSASFTSRLRVGYARREFVPPATGFSAVTQPVQRSTIENLKHHILQHISHEDKHGEAIREAEWLDPDVFAAKTAITTRAERKSSNDQVTFERRVKMTCSVDLWKMP
jgi:hypothetical protein